MLNRINQVYELFQEKVDEPVLLLNSCNNNVSVEEKETDSNYDLSILNTSIPAEKIVQMIQNALAYDIKNKNKQGIKILFYGVSGGGKTKLAHYIADSMGKKILSKNASDLLGMYVGDSEKNIAKAFSEAKGQKKVLLFDEVDSFFRDRTLASQRFEITETNEFLTQMENYKGIVICTTNLRGIMDKAMQRRFDFMVEFKSLENSGVNVLLKKYFSDFNFPKEDVEKLCDFKSVTPGDFGNLFSRLRFLNPEEVTYKYIIDELCKMQEEKGYGKKTIGFGF